MTDEDTKKIDAKYLSLQKILKEMGRIVVGFSGGVDSTFLLKVAHDILGSDVLAVTALSDTTSRGERQDAARISREIGAEHLMIETHELDIPEFAENPLDKCYICKKHRFGGLVQLAKERGYPVVVDGGNLDDHTDYRPGIRATKELGVRSPLSEAGLTKKDIRHLSRKLNLSTWDKQSAACLASRIPYHSPITGEKLQQVDAAETFLRELGLPGQIRVRHDGNAARIELESRNIPTVAETDMRERIIQAFKAMGFKFVTLDLEGYSMGSLNKVIAEEKG